MNPKFSVLIIEDETHILNFMRKILTSHDYKVLSANTGKAGLEIISSQCPDIILRQTLQFKNDRSGQQSSVDLKIRILCRCTDQNDRAVLHERKQIILLPLIEAMNLIDKEDRLPAVHSLVVLRLRDHFLHVLLAGRSRIDL